MSIKASPPEMQYLRDQIKQKSGIFLTEEKDYLLETRLLPVIRKHNIKDLSELIEKIKAGDKKLMEEVVEAMTTNETSFFRDMKPFNALKDKIIPQLMQERGGEPLKILSAACSSGQEPYSLAFLLSENKSQWKDQKVTIHAIDLDRTILRRAQEGIYTQFEVQRGLPIALLLKYFTQEEERWRIKKEIRDMVTFSPGNLLEAHYDGGPYDVILCRNVLIYFETEMKKRVIAGLVSNLRPGGFLIIGASESGFGLHPEIKMFGETSGVYQLNKEA